MCPLVSSIGTFLLLCVLFVGHALKNGSKWYAERLKFLYNFHGIYIIYKCDCGLQVGEQCFDLFTLFYECFMLGLGVYEFTDYCNFKFNIPTILNYIIYILYKTWLVWHCISLQEVYVFNQAQWLRNYEPQDRTTSISRQCLKLSSYSVSELLPITRYGKIQLFEVYTQSTCKICYTLLLLSSLRTRS